MSLAPGRHRLGPANGSVLVRTYREGMAAKAGHDLVIDVTRWEATVEVGDAGGVQALELEVDPHSLDVVEGIGGVKPLTDKDRAEIQRTIESKVLAGRPISFHSTTVRPAETGGRLQVEGELTLGGRARPVAANLDAGGDGSVSGTVSVTQSEWGIKPYRGLMGALKVRDDVEVVIAVRLPSG